MALQPVALPRLPSNVPIVDERGQPTLKHSVDWNALAARIEQLEAAIIALGG